jgi:putative peptidoglycan lipid II flippase
MLVAGVLEVALLAGATARADVLPKFRRIAWDADVKRFFAALGPAVIGSGGVQLALFADTIIASFLPAGAISALYYADRLNQLPIGVIGIAVGTVLLPEMSRRIAAGDEAGARRAQGRAIEFTLLLSVPCLVAFLVIPDLILRALFARGAFTAANAAAAGATLAAYALGLVPFVLIRSVVATFFARGDTATPVKAALTAVPVNIAFKIMLMGPLAQVGLALATTIGAWINFALVLWFAARAGHLRRDHDLMRAVGKLAAAGLALGLVLFFAQRPVLDLFAGWGRWRDLIALAVLAAIGGGVYVGVVLALFGRQWLAQLRQRRAGASGTRDLMPTIPNNDPSS